MLKVAVAAAATFWLSTASAQCHFPAGGIAPDDVPCNPDAEYSPCCYFGQACLSNGLCVNNPLSESTREYARGTCTDPIFEAEECPKFCYNPPNLGAPLQKCNNGTLDQYCCGDECQCTDGFEVLTFEGEPETLTIIGVPFTPTGSAASSRTSTATSRRASRTPSTAPSESTSGADSTSTDISSDTSGSESEESSNSDSESDSSSGSKDNVAVGAGVGVGIAVGIIAIFSLFFFLWWRRAKKRLQGPPPQELPGSNVYADKPHQLSSDPRKFELENRSPAFQLHGETRSPDAYTHMERTPDTYTSVSRTPDTYSSINRTPL